MGSIINTYLYAILVGVGVFYCLAGKTLITEVKAVFEAVDRSVEEGRTQVGRIVGRDTSDLSPQEIRAAALETLAENLSDGVIAPMFWFGFLGLPGMMAYKMINTLDSMIGYKNEQYKEFGVAAARLDDVANYIPARLTACLMLLVSGNWHKRDFLTRFGRAPSQSQFRLSGSSIGSHPRLSFRGYTRLLRSSSGKALYRSQRQAFYNRRYVNSN